MNNVARFVGWRLLYSVNVLVNIKRASQMPTIVVGCVIWQSVSVCNVDLAVVSRDKHCCFGE